MMYVHCALVMVTDPVKKQLEILGCELSSGCYPFIVFASECITRIAERNYHEPPKIGQMDSKNPLIEARYPFK
jgi:hypothetical protein